LKVELLTGIPTVLDVARRMGATTLTQPDSYYGPSLTLGAYPVSLLDMAVATSTLADLSGPVGVAQQSLVLSRAT